MVLCRYQAENTGYSTKSIFLFCALIVGQNPVENTTSATGYIHTIHKKFMETQSPEMINMWHTREKSTKQCKIYIIVLG